MVIKGKILFCTVTVHFLDVRYYDDHFIVFKISSFSVKNNLLQMLFKLEELA